MTHPSAAVKRFEFGKGNSHKFKEIQARRAEVTVRLGRIGAGGQTQVTSFADAEADATHVKKMVREK